MGKKGVIPVEYRPGAPGFTRWRGVNTEGDPGSTLPGNLLEAWNVRFDGPVFRARPGETTAFTLPAGSLNEEFVIQPDVAAIIPHHVDKPPRRLLVLDTILGSVDVERPKFALFASTTGIQDTITLPTLSSISSSMLGSLSCAPVWHDGKLYGGILTEGVGRLVELTSTPNFDTLRGRVVYNFATDTAVVALLSVDDGLLVASDTLGSTNISLWDGVGMDSELTGVATIGSMVKHNGKAFAHAFVGENLLHIRDTDGTWTTAAPTSGTIADARGSFNTLASVGKYVFVASGNEGLFAYDDETGGFTQIYTLGNATYVITSVARWLNQQCAFCFYDSVNVDDGVFVGRFDTRATVIPGITQNISVVFTPTSFPENTAVDFTVQEPRAIISYKSRLYVRTSAGLLVSPANSIGPVNEDPNTPDVQVAPLGWQTIMASAVALTGGLAVI